MTSLGCDQDRNINRDGGGPYVFKVQGRLYHQAGALIPHNETTPPVYAQLYIHDAQAALDYRMGHQANAGLDRHVMGILQEMLYNRHPAVQLYKQAYEITQHMGPECKIALCFDSNTDHRRYNLPTITSNEIPVIIPGDDNQPTAGWDITLRKCGGGL